MDDQASSQGSQTPPPEDAGDEDFRLLADGFTAARATRMPRAALLTARPSRKAAVACCRIVERIRLRARWAGHSKCPQEGQGASPVVSDGSTQDRAAQIGQRRGSPPPQVRDETTQDMDRSLRNSGITGSQLFAPDQQLFREVPKSRFGIVPGPPIFARFRRFSLNVIPLRTRPCVRVDSVYNFNIF